MSLNVRRRVRFPTRRADVWNERRPLLQRLLDLERPSIVGLQEVLPDQSADIDEMLGRRYAMVGSGRDADHGGERCEIRVDAERLRIIDSRSWWLSDRPEVPASRSYGNLFPRIAIQCELEDVELGTRFAVIVTHLDHLSARSRVRSARQIRGVAASLAGPAVVMGDFNTATSSVVSRELTAGGLLLDTWSIAARRLSPEWGTYSNYGSPRPRGRRMDWLLVTASATVDAAGINVARFGTAAVSDHEPVHALIRWSDVTPSGTQRG